MLEYEENYSKNGMTMDTINELLTRQNFPDDSCLTPFHQDTMSLDCVQRNNVKLAWDRYGYTTEGKLDYGAYPGLVRAVENDVYRGEMDRYLAVLRWQLATNGIRLTDRF